MQFCSFWPNFPKVVWTFYWSGLAVPRIGAGFLRFVTLDWLLRWDHKENLPWFGSRYKEWMWSRREVWWHLWMPQLPATIHCSWWTWAPKQSPWGSMPQAKLECGSYGLYMCSISFAQADSRCYQNRRIGPSRYSMDNPKGELLLPLEEYVV